MKTDYEILEKEFEQKVKVLQDACQHKKSTWCEKWWALGHCSGYNVRICDNCNKELEQKPTIEEREAERQKWLDERKS